MTVECTKYRAMNRGNLLGFADIYVPKWGVEIMGCTHCKKDNNEWVNLPSKEYTKPDTNEKAYAMTIKFKDKNLGYAFSAQCLEAVKSKMAEMSSTTQCGTAPSDNQEFPF